MSPDNPTLTSRFLASRDTEDDDTHAVRLLEVTRLVHGAWWYATDLHVTMTRRPARRVTLLALTDGRAVWPHDNTPASLAQWRGRNGQDWRDVAAVVEAHLSALLAGFDDPVRLGWRSLGGRRWQVPLFDRRAGRALAALESLTHPDERLVELKHPAAPAATGS